MAYTIRQYATKAGKRYEVRYRKPDGTTTGKRGFRRKMDADAWGAANVTTAKSVGAYIDPQAGRRLVEDFWEPWIAAKKTKAKPSYIKSLESDAKRWVVRGGSSSRGRGAWPHDDSRSAAYGGVTYGAVRR